ncbi:MAG: hypothetical protein NUV82_00560 [Candidatus Komeilibacteria bacterium]|nr:hypothetical protein [Candidatus Komeilibacteria bacterium]
MTNSKTVSWKDKWNYKIEIKSREKIDSSDVDAMRDNPTAEIYTVRDLKPTRDEIALIRVLAQAYNDLLRSLNYATIKLVHDNVHILSEAEFKKKILCSSPRPSLAALFSFCHCYVVRGSNRFVLELAHELCHYYGYFKLGVNIGATRREFGAKRMGLAVNLDTEAVAFVGFNEAMTELITHQVVEVALKNSLLPSKYKTVDLRSHTYESNIAILDYIGKKASGTDSAKESLFWSNLMRAYFTGNHKYMRCVLNNDLLWAVVAGMGCRDEDALRTAYALGSRALMNRIKKINTEVE